MFKLCFFCSSEDNLNHPLGTLVDPPKDTSTTDIESTTYGGMSNKRKVSRKTTGFASF